MLTSSVSTRVSLTPDARRATGTAHKKSCGRETGMRQQIGFLLQYGMLIFLPMLLYYSVVVGFRWLVVMPASIAAAAAVFWIGHKLRET